ncbi:TIGR00645 family protein [Pelomicrobium methylotrophicum]|uniref:TIGR00645 family protein n=1 Tax=Pelomicrobium methylotrophicum TaxID=2602750 RepID=UPI001F27C269|nr:TIGR00645 family protein [Pelomicrobium methylotrophicum]
MIEQRIEHILFATRWLLAPIYLGLSVALIALGIKFFEELLHTLPNVLAMAETDLILTVLALVDIALVGSLIVMVMLSGYENFISRIDVEAAHEKLGWMGKLDAGTLKVKVAASIVAISSIHLLRVFMNLQQIDNSKLLWYVVFHMTFVVSALLLGLIDRLVFAGHPGKARES